MLKQLKKLKIKLTVWQLIIASQKQGQLMLAELSKIDLSPKAMLKEMIALITSRKGIITFSSVNLALGGLPHNNALYITAICL